MKSETLPIGVSQSDRLAYFKKRSLFMVVWGSGVKYTSFLVESFYSKIFITKLVRKQLLNRRDLFVLLFYSNKPEGFKRQLGY